MYSRLRIHGARDARARVALGRAAQCDGERLERRLGAVVAVVFSQHIDLQRQARGARELLEEVRSA